jgi:Arc/MetJ-type ribon-helix-helix transcriptional regulator
MDADADDRDPMEKIDVRVPASVLERINEEYPRRGYSSRSEAIRDALRDWLNPSPELSDEILDDLQTSREQRERGATVSGAKVREQVNAVGSVSQSKERERGGDTSDDEERRTRHQGGEEFEFDGSNDELLDKLGELKDDDNE